MILQRIALGIRYDGSAYHGWQSQDDLPTVQRSIERALGVVANHTVSVSCAGRTDAGVHATCQVVHFDSHANRTEHAWVFGANSNLPSDITVRWAKPVPHEFHARHSAQGRRYRYLLLNQDVRPGILRNAVGWYYRHLDESKMHEAAQHLIGEHDFSAFRGAGCQSKTPMRRIFEITVLRRASMIILEVHGNAFLLHMVRNIAGVLMEIGAGAKPPIWAKEVLETRDRKQAGMTISPKGLYLVDVDYPELFSIPKMPLGPFFLG
jgi:tRNA pseudouridine38-40 synthase